MIHERFSKLIILKSERDIFVDIRYIKKINNVYRT